MQNICKLVFRQFSASTDSPFGHLKAIAADKGGQMLFKAANVGEDAGVVDASGKEALIIVAKTRQWDRIKSIRTLV